MAEILLVGSDEPLLEGLAQSFAALGHAPRVATSIGEARELAIATPPLVAVVARSFATEAGGDALGIRVAPGGAIVLYRGVGTMTQPLPYVVHRQVLADLALPLERNRLVALVQHVEDRAVTVGRRALGPAEDQAQV
jgi:ActR/RegA family two-component response regulator